MYSNFQQPPVYEPPSTVYSSQPIYSNQYEQVQYINNTNMDQQFPLQPQYFDNTYMNQQSQPQYFDNTYMNQQSQPQYFDNTYMNQQSQPINQTSPEQPPPPYSTNVQSSPYLAPTQQQQQSLNSNSNSSSNNSRPPSGTPFSSGYKWPRKSISVVCPQCGATVKTRVETSITITTIISAIILFVLTCILACIPLLFSSFKKTTHYCPYCNSVLGIRRGLR